MKNKDVTQFEILREKDSWAKTLWQNENCWCFTQASLNKQTLSQSTSLPIETPSIVYDSNLITSDSFALWWLISESKVLTDIQHVESSSSEDKAPPNKMRPIMWKTVYHDGVCDNSCWSLLCSLKSQFIFPISWKCPQNPNFKAMG